MKRITNPLLYLLSNLILCFGMNAQSISTDKNAVKQSVYTQATTNILDGSDPTKAIISIKYFDGLGRPLQQVGYRLTPQQKDLVTDNVTYDALSRPNITHLPTPSTANTGAYVGDVTNPAIAFYNNDAAPFSKNQYEASPLNRVTKQYGAGQAWQNASKGISISYEVATENIRKYELNTNNDVLLAGSYPLGQLYKNRVTDEQGHQVIEFKDASNHLILKQMQDDVASWISTYYVYDNLWRLVAVIQPTAYELNQSLTANSTNWNEGVFLYKYDGEGRLMAKKIPSADWEYFIFDNWDRMVYSQDGLQRQLGQWKFYKYDILNRLILSGLKAETRSQAVLQAEANSWSGGRYESKTTNSPIYYSFTSSYPNTIITTDISQITYYDDYQYWLQPGMSFVSNDYGNTAYASAKGLQTGSASKNLETGAWLFRANYYDSKARTIQTFQHNALNRIDRQDFQYSFGGNLLKQRTYYMKADGTTIVENTQQNYDYANRVNSIRHGFSATANDEIVQINYDEIGRVAQKRIKAVNASNNKFLKCKVLLAGAINGNSMRTDLSVFNVIPTTEPYTALGGRFTHVGGGGNEQTTASVLAGNAATNNAIVDWVFIELRDALNSANILKTKSALLQADGDIVDMDGISDVNLGVLPLSSYFVAIKHRNHLGAMTAEAVSFASTTTTVDFINRTPAQIYEKQSSYDAGERRSTPIGYALWAGDASKDGLIIYSGANNDVNYVFVKVFNDPGNVLQSNSYSVKGYNVEDVNLDQQVIYQGSNNELAYIQNSVASHPLNVFASNNFYITEQLPANSVTQASASTLSALQTVDYKYHIRGGLLGMNLNAANLPIPNAQESDLFSYRLDYETAGQWDGNIGKQLWANPQNQVRSYTFTYDYAKRLKSAVYAGINSENYGMPSITYDKNGNITTLQRNGKVGAGFALMDNLTYSYAGNRLQRVEDAISGDNTVDFVNRNGGTDDYDYYTDGSLKKDLNKEITQIDYDAFLKLPKLITLTNNRWIKITYAANGQVLKRTYSTGEFWEYDGGLVYKNGLPYQLSTPEGRATYTSNVWNYEYVIKDHLGNNRITFKANGTNPQLIDNTDFDPFGIELNGTGVNNPVENRFKYQNKETLALFGLNGINDFGARFLDKTTGRWWAVDPMAEDFEDITGYNYTNNNPLRFVDLDGMQSQSVQDFNGRWHEVRDNDKVTIYQNTEANNEKKDGQEQGNEGKGEGEKTKPASGVSENSLLRYVPMVGSGLDAYDSFSEGNIGMGLLHTGLAVSDAFLVKSLVTGIGKAVWKAGVKNGVKRYFGIGMSQEAGNAIARLKRLGVFPQNSRLHHWLLHDDLLRANPWLKPFGNQAWNFKSFGNQASHMRWAHGQAFPSLGLGKITGWQLMYPISSTPSWFTFGVLPYTIKSANR